MFMAREITYYSDPQKSLVNSVLQITEFNVCVILSKLTMKSNVPDTHTSMCRMESKVSRVAFRFICFGDTPKPDNLKRKEVGFQ